MCAVRVQVVLLLCGVAIAAGETGGATNTTAGTEVRVLLFLPANTVVLTVLYW